MTKPLKTTMHEIMSAIVENPKHRDREFKFMPGDSIKGVFQKGSGVLEFMFKRIDGPDVEEET